MLRAASCWRGQSELDGIKSALRNQYTLKKEKKKMRDWIEGEIVL